MKAQRSKKSKNETVVYVGIFNSLNLNYFGSWSGLRTNVVPSSLSMTNVLLLLLWLQSGRNIFSIKTGPPSRLLHAAPRVCYAVIHPAARGRCIVPLQLQIDKVWTGGIFHKSLRWNIDQLYRDECFPAWVWLSKHASVCHCGLFCYRSLKRFVNRACTREVVTADVSNLHPQAIINTRLAYCTRHFRRLTQSNYIFLQHVNVIFIMLRATLDNNNVKTQCFGFR